MLSPGDLLHQAGHIAVTEAAKRSTVSGADLGDAGEEIVTILWSFAAARKLEFLWRCFFTHKAIRANLSG